MSTTSNNRIDPSTTGFHHDAAGNVTYDGAHHYFYDAENRLSAVDYTGDCSTSTACYFYNAAGQRISKYSQGGSLTTFYLYDTSGEVLADTDGNQNWDQTYIHFGGQLVAQYRGTATGFLIKDHLGSTRLDTLYPYSGPSSVYDNMDYLPFGEQIAGGSGTTHKFTGKERDSESTLDNFGARYFSSPTGRFTSPDPDGAGSLEQDPQSWNMYAYARNNPLKYTDPDGRSYDVCVDNGNGGRNCVHYKNDADFESAAAKSGATLQDGNILVNGQVIGSYKHNIDAGVENGGTSEDNILAPILAAGLIGGLRAGIRGIAEGLFGGGAKAVVEETAVATAEQIVSGGTKQAVRDALENSGLTDAAKATIKSALRRGAAGDKFTIEKLADGTVTIAREVAGRAGGRAVYEQVIDGATGITKSVVQKAYDAAGNLVHVDPKFP
jgi:RHS repeat-associated protein